MVDARRAQVALAQHDRSRAKIGVSVQLRRFPTTPDRTPALASWPMVKDDAENRTGSHDEQSATREVNSARVVKTLRRWNGTLAAILKHASAPTGSSRKKRNCNGDVRLYTLRGSAA